MGASISPQCEPEYTVNHVDQELKQLITRYPPALVTIMGASNGCTTVELETAFGVMQMVNFGTKEKATLFCSDSQTPPIQ